MTTKSSVRSYCSLYQHAIHGSRSARWIIEGRHSSCESAGSHHFGGTGCGQLIGANGRKELSENRQLGLAWALWDQTRGSSPEPAIIAYLSSNRNSQYFAQAHAQKSSTLPGCVIEHETERVQFAQSIEEGNYSKARGANMPRGSSDQVETFGTQKYNKSCTKNTTKVVAVCYNPFHFPGECPSHEHWPIRRASIHSPVVRCPAQHSGKRTTMGSLAKHRRLTDRFIDAIFLGMVVISVAGLLYLFSHR